jgi:hypothetical protein
MSEMRFDLSEINDFVERRLWKQVAEDCLARALMLSEDNDMLDPIKDPTKIARNQGEIAALKWAVDLPRIIKEEVLTTKKEEKRDGNDTRASK